MPQADMSEQEFLAGYDPSKYERPSVTSDVAVLTLDPADRLQILLIRRGGHPYKNCWALPGGFLMAGRESSEQAAARELFEETSIKDARLMQLATFSDPMRDPRTHVVSVAYIALVPKGSISFRAGDDAADAALFLLDSDKNGPRLTGPDGHVLKKSEMAFDHGKIVALALARLRGRIRYEPDAFELLEDKSAFTVQELRRVFRAVDPERCPDTPNFRKMFFRDYVSKGFAKALAGRAKAVPGAKPAQLYTVT